jgi:hypothetical protein
MKTTLKYNNFSSGLINKSLQGRVDLEIYNNSLHECKNFSIKSSGALEYRGGFLYESAETLADYTLLTFTYSEFREFIVKITNETTNNVRIYAKDVNNKLQLFQTLTDTELGNNKDNLSSANYYDQLIIANYNFRPKRLTFSGSGFSIDYFPISIVMSTGQTPPFMQNSNGYPHKVVFYQNRLCFLCTKERLTTIFVSDFNDINTFTFRLTSDELYSPSIDGFFRPILYLTSKPMQVIQNQNYIAVFSATETLIIVSNGEFTSTTSEPYKVDSQGIYKSLTPFVYQSNLIFLDSSGKNLKILTYSYETQSYKTTIINRYCDSYFSIAIKSIAIKEDVNSLFFLREDNKIIELNLDLTNNVDAISLWEFNGAFGIKNIYSISRNDYVRDLYVDLTVGTQTYICRYAYNLLPPKARKDFFKGDEVRDFIDFISYSAGYDLGLCYLDLFQDLTQLEENLRFDFTDKRYLKREDGQDWNASSQNSQYKLYDYENSLILIVNSYQINPLNPKEMEYEIKTKYYTPADLPPQYIIVKNKTQLDLTNLIYWQNPTLRNIPLRIIGDGVDLGEFDISQNPVIDFTLLNINAGVIKVGYSYTGLAITNNMGFDFNGQTTQVTKKQVMSLIIRLNNSKEGMAGTNFYDLQTIQNQEYENILETETPSMNFDVVIKVLDNYAELKETYILQNKPYPLNVDMICVKMDSQL